MGNEIKTKNEDKDDTKIKNADDFLHLLIETVKEPFNKFKIVIKSNLDNKQKDWISKLTQTNEIFANKTMFDITIPGTHHSGILEVPHGLRSFCICQSHDIKTQLYAGVRYFDIRVMYDTKDSNFYLAHTYCSTLKITAVFQVFVDFLQEEKDEILIISLRKDWENKKSITNEVGEILLSYAIKYFGDKIIDNTEESAKLTIKELIKSCKRIIFVGDIETFPNWSYDLSWISTRSHKPMKLISNCDEYLKQIEFGKKFIVLETIITLKIGFKGFFSNMDHLAYQVNGEVIKKLKEKLWTKTNVILCDFVDQQLIDTIILQNY